MDSSALFDHSPGRTATPPKRVLIADDNGEVRKLLQSFIEQQPGIEVCGITESGTETVDFATALRPDLLILDVNMPGLNGIEVASVLKKNLPGTKTILFTMYSNSVSQALLSATGASAVLAKEDGLTGLARALRWMLGQKLEEVCNSLSQARDSGAIDRQHLESLTSRLAVPLTRCGRDLKYLWANQYYADWLRKPVDKIIGRSIIDVVGREAFDTLRNRFEQALSGQDVTYEVEAIYESIGPRRISAAYKPTFQADGKPDGWLAFVDDTTDSPEVLPSDAGGIAAISAD